MSLIFTDTLQATDSTGLYTLQALIDGTWTDIHTISGAQSGSIEVDAALHTVEVDTALLPVGQTFLFRWVDSIGNESNVSSLMVPFTLEQYFSVVEAISIANNGGDNWTFTVPYTPPSNEPGDTLGNRIIFYSDTGETTLVDTTGIASDQSYNYSGHGAGTYVIAALYTNSLGAHFVLSQALIMVDGAGTVLREAVFSGFTGVSMSGMNVSCTAQFTVTNATVDPMATGFVALDGTFSNGVELAPGTSLTDQQLPAFNPVEVYCHIGLVAGEWTLNATDGDVIGCIMTLTTNV
jgi:hypothetical protein